MGAAAKIGELAKEKGIALKELSRRIDIPYTTLYNAVKRDSKIDFETVQKAAKALDVGPGELLGEVEWALATAVDTLQKGQKNGWEDGTDELFDAEKLEKRMERAYYSLNFNGKQVAVERIEELAQLPQYQNAAGDSTQSAPQDAPIDADDKETTGK